MADSILTIEQMADWISPSQAVEILKAAYNDLYLAKETLLERLRGGMVRSISEETVIEGARPHRTMNVQIPAAHWKNIHTTDSVWKTGDLSYQFLDDHSAYRSKATARHFNVRFDPVAVRAIIKNLVPKISPTDPEASSHIGPEMKGPRVTEPHLKAWFVFYKAVHSPIEDTENRALQHARQCFPGKSVSRDRIRALRGTSKRGPKTKPT
jgi:hypothetical protein